jgi:hypothetical protein
MRNYSLQRHCNWLSVLSMLAIVSSGCGEQQLPESKIPGGSRALMENPLGVAAQLKGAEAKAAAQAKLSDKTKKELEKAKLADPRGH